MPIIKLDKVKKYYGDKLILDIEDLEINEGLKVGIVGENGAGKTTLIKIILGLLAVDEGNINLCCNYSYISQNDNYLGQCDDGKIKSLLKAPNEYNDFLSGGEKVKINITKAFGSNTKLLVADEPTSNLDIRTIKIIENLFKEYKGTLLLVSHDREFLTNLCDNILEVANGKVTLYKGNFSKYLQLKLAEKEVEQKEYESYMNEKKRLAKAINSKESHRDSLKKTPKRMGNSEARLHKMGDQRSKQNLDGNIKALKSRINHLEIKEKPIESKDIIIKIPKNCEMTSKIVMDIRNFSLHLSKHLLIDHIDFKIKKGKKVALIGENGCGKTTLLKEIIQNTNENIRLSKYISIGYFDQYQSILDETKSILENIKKDSSLKETFIRINLDNFGFDSTDIYKKVSVLSGGEKVKVALCKTILSDNNILILDEPTNYLDIKSITALENALKNTEKTVLMVSHDRNFISKICDTILEVKNNRLVSFSGNYNEFIEYKENISLKKNLNNDERIRKESLFLLENELSKIISELSIEKNEKLKAELDLQYKKVLEDIKNLKNKG